MKTPSRKSDSRALSPEESRYAGAPTWRVGDVVITKIIEMETTQDGSGLIAKATPERLRKINWLKPDFATDEGLARMSIHALIIDTPSKRIIVDTCFGNDKDRILWPDYHNLHLPFLEDLEAAGFTRGSFDFVLCTHLHADHVGWNTMLDNGQWVPTFPQARYLMNRTEYEYWKDGSDITLGGFNEIQRLTFEDSVQPVVEAGLVDFVEAGHVVAPEVELISTPGHSPGHMSVLISSVGQKALITGDMAHHPCQLAHMDWGTVFDFDPVQASCTRVEMFAYLADQGSLVIGTHWAGATAGIIVREGEAFRLETL